MSSGPSNANPNDYTMNIRAHPCIHTRACFQYLEWIVRLTCLRLLVAIAIAIAISIANSTD